VYGTLKVVFAQILEQGKKLSYQTVNAVLTSCYWQVGRQIVEFEQGGKQRAEYGESIIDQLAIDLTEQFGSGFSKRNIEQMRKFYLLWPKAQSLPALFKLSWTHYVRLILRCMSGWC
jgi:hypothetical protein